jgi:outer membrane protein TolC
MRRLLAVAALLGPLVAVESVAQPPAPGALTRHEVLERLVASNPLVRDALAAVRDARLSVLALDGRWDWLASGTLGYDRNEVYPGGSGNGDLNIDATTTWSASFARQLRWGTQLGVSFAQGRRTQQVPCSEEVGDDFLLPCIVYGYETGPIDFGPWYTSSLAFTLRQPLLRNRGEQTALWLEEQAAQEVVARQVAVRRGAVEAALEALVAYADVARAQAEIEAARRAEERARRLIEMGRALVDGHRLAPADLAAFDLRLLASREAGVVASQAMRARVSALRGLIGLDEFTSLSVAEPLRPAEDLPTGVPSLCEAAAQSSPELVELSARFRQAELARLAAGEEQLPSLDLRAQFTPTGTSDAFGPSLADLGSLEARSYGTGLTFSMPLGNRTAQRRVEQADLSLERLRTQRATIEQNLCREVALYVDALQSLAERRELASLRREQALAGAEARRARFEAGYGTVDEIVTSEEVLDESELSLIRLDAEREQVSWRLKARIGQLLVELDSAGLAEASR